MCSGQGTTCHNGVQKPLYGVSMIEDYVDALSKKTQTGVPDYGTYVPGETLTLEPAPEPGTTSSLAPALAPAGATGERNVAAVVGQ